MNLLKIIYYASNLSAVPAIWIGRRQRSLLWFYVLASLLFDINGFILRWLLVPRLWASNLFFVVEFALISAYFIQNVFPLRYRVSAVVTVLFVIAGFTIHTGINDFMQGNYVGAAILYGIYIFYCLYGLYKVINEIEFVMVDRNPLFIFCVAFLLYASGIFIILLFRGELLQFEKKFVRDIWMSIQNPLNIIKNLLIAHGFWLINRNRNAAGKNKML